MGAYLQEAPQYCIPLVNLYLFYTLFGQQHMEDPQIERVHSSPQQDFHTTNGVDIVHKTQLKYQNCNFGIDFTKMNLQII